jgi:hypothetical protein
MLFMPVKAKCKRGTTIFRHHRAFILLSVGLFVAGCASSTIEEAVPQAALGAAPAGLSQTGASGASGEEASKPGAQAGNMETKSRMDVNEAAADGSKESGPVAASRLPNDSGKPIAGIRTPEGAGSKNDEDGFPDLNTVPQTGAAQISDSEKKAVMRELEQARQQQTAPPNAADDHEIKRLRELAETNAKDVLREIEASGKN